MTLITFFAAETMTTCTVLVKLRFKTIWSNAPSVVLTDSAIICKLRVGRKFREVFQKTMHSPFDYDIFNLCLHSQMVSNSFSVVLLFAYSSIPSQCMQHGVKYSSEVLYCTVFLLASRYSQRLQIFMG